MQEARNIITIHSHKTGLILLGRQENRATMCTSSGENAERVGATKKSFNVSVLAKSKGLDDNERCEDRNFEQARRGTQ